MARVSRPRRGIVLLAVLVILVLLSLAAYQFSELMMAEHTAVTSYTRSVQTRALADSGIHYTAALLSDPDQVTEALGDNPYDNPEFFQNIPVGADASNGQFSILSVKNPEELVSGAQSYRFGVNDESGKINLNSLLLLDGGQGNVALQILLILPNMTEDTANSILDWLDEDDTPRSGGAENETYTALATPYLCKNGPLDSIEELLLVQGVTPELLFGNDRNRNGVLDPSEENDAGVVDSGWSAYFTIYSRERNLKPDGTAKLYLNDRDINTQATELNEMVGEEMSYFIQAYRLYGGQQISGEPPSGDIDFAKLYEEIDDDKRGRRRRRLRSIASIYDLVNAQVSVSVGSGNNRETIVFPSPLLNTDQAREILPALLNEVTTTRDTDLVPRINVNTAPRAVIAALPGLDEGQVQAIFDRRPDYTASNAPDPIYQTTAWLLTEARLPPATLRGLDRFLTARSQVYRFQVMGYFTANGPVSRLEAVVDTNYGRPRIVYWRDLTGLGRGLSLGEE